MIFKAYILTFLSKNDSLKQVFIYKKFDFTSKLVDDLVLFCQFEANKTIFGRNVFGKMLMIS